jgi:hypothetical protein
MNLDELYKQYGQATIQLEIAQNRHQELKNLIAQELQKKPIQVKKEEPKNDA